MKNKGFIQIIIILVLLLIILSLMGVSLSSLASNPILAQNFGFVKVWTLWLWNNYLAAPAHYIWEIFVGLVWNQFVGMLKDIKNGTNPFQNLNPTPNPAPAQ